MQKILLLEDDIALGNGIRLAPQGPHAFSYCEDLTFTVEQGSFADRYCEKWIIAAIIQTSSGRQK